MLPWKWLLMAISLSPSSLRKARDRVTHSNQFWIFYALWSLPTLFVVTSAYEVSSSPGHLEFLRWDNTLTTTCFVKDTLALSWLFQVLTRYELTTEAKLNLFKTEAMWLGSWRTRSDTPLKKIKKIKNDLQVAHPRSGSSSTWFLVVLEFRSVGFWGEGKTWAPGEKPLGTRERTNNKLNPHSFQAG